MCSFSRFPEKFPLQLKWGTFVIIIPFIKSGSSPLQHPPTPAARFRLEYLTCQTVGGCDTISPLPSLCCTSVSYLWCNLQHVTSGMWEEKKKHDFACHGEYSGSRYSLSEDRIMLFGLQCSSLSEANLFEQRLLNNWLLCFSWIPPPPLGPSRVWLWPLKNRFYLALILDGYYYLGQYDATWWQMSAFTSMRSLVTTSHWILLCIGLTCGN